MKAMVLAAGLGTRLRPYTDFVPKPLFPVLGIPAIEWALASLRQAGVLEAVINLHHRPEEIVRHLGAGERIGIRLSYSVEPIILGTGGGLSAVRSFLSSEDMFLLHNGDAFTDFDLTALIAWHRSCKADATLALFDDPKRTEARLVELDGHKVIGIGDRPISCGGPRYVFTGISVFSPAIFDFLPVGEPSCLVESGLIPMLKAGLRVCGLVQSGTFCDIGTVRRFLDLQWQLMPRVTSLFASRGFRPPSTYGDRVLLHGSPCIDEDVSLNYDVLICDRAIIRQGAIIGPRVIVCEGAEIGSDAIISDAVVFPAARVNSEAQGIVMSPDGAYG